MWTTPTLRMRALCGLVARVALPGCSDAPRPARPNVILFLTDDLGWTGTSVQMDPEVRESQSDFYRTPALQRLAREGMRFSDAYAPAPNCSPSRLSILTGKSPAQAGTTDIVDRGPEHRFYRGHALVPPPPIRGLPSEEATLPELLESFDPGYVTAHFGKWHLRGGGPGAHGFDVHDGATSNSQGNRKLPGNPKDIVGVTDRALRFMAEQAAAGRPFYLQISHYAVHLFVEALSTTQDDYRNRSPSERHRHPGYAAMTADLDSSLARVLDQIDELGIAEQTYVIFTSDNGAIVHGGYNTNAPLARGKATLWEGGIRVPLVVRGPGIEPNSVSRVPVIGWDLLPTVLDLVGAPGPLPDGVEGGGSLRPLLTGEADTVERPRPDLVWHFPHYQTEKGSTPHSAIRAGNFKLIWFWETDDVLLFDLGGDIGEREDLSAAQPERTDELRTRLRVYLAEVGARLPLPNPEFGGAHPAP